MQDRSRLMLLILIPLMAVLAYQYKDFFMPGGDDAAAGDSLADYGGEMKELAGLPQLALERPVAGADYAAYRDLFQFTDSPEAVARKEMLAERKAKDQKKAKERREKMEQERKKNNANRERTQSKREPKPPEFRYEYHAFLGPISDHYAVLTKGGGRDGKKENMRIVRVGEIVDEDFVIKKIDLDTLVVGFTNPKFRSKTKTLTLKQPREKAGGARSGSKKRGGNKRRR